MRNLIALSLLLIAGSALGVGTSHWNHTSEADFKKGTFHNVVATNLGEVKLSRAVKTLLEQDAKVSAVYALAEAPDGVIYAATGPNGVLMQLKDGKTSVAATFEDANLFCVKVDKSGAILIGTGGEKGRIWRIEKPGSKPVEIFSADGVQYVWAMTQTPDGNLYAATGPNGQLFEITPDGKKSVVYDSDENNLLSLVSDGKDTLYVGTDPNGLVYKINRKTKDAFVLFDAPEAEITVLVLDAKGNLYAGTSEANENEGGAADAGTTEKTGRPERSGTTAPITSPPPKHPKPPVLPEPNPGEPKPIPKEPGKETSMVPQVGATVVPTVPGAGDAGTDETSVAHRRARGVVYCADVDLEQALAAADDAERAPAPAPSRPPRKGAVPTKGTRPQPRTPAAAPDAPARAEGNAIYRIDPNGFVTEVFRQNVVVLSIVENDGTLLVGTGTDGLVYQVNIPAEETVVLAKVDSKQVLSLLPTRDGRVIMGLANSGSLAAMTGGYATDGWYSSPVLDATQISRWGKLRLQGLLPKSATLTVATRSSNVRDSSASGWSKWSEEKTAAEFVQIPSPAGRFLQYRLTFTSKDGSATASVDEVDVAYQIPNLPPQIRSVKITSGGGDAAPTPNAAAGPRNQRGAARGMSIQWEAVDPNNDALEYSLYFRSANRGSWVLLKDKLTETSFDWDTKTVPDGRYEIKVIASDAKSNPIGQGLSASRVSDRVVVDNTPPVIGDLRTEIVGAKVTITAKVVDRMGIVAAVDYAIDSKDDWQAAAASDNIFDSPEEAVTIAPEALAPGSHVIMIRATDDRGNQSLESVTVTIAQPAK